MFFRYSVEQLIYFTPFSEVCQELFSFLFSNIFWCVSTDFSAATQLEYHKRVILSSTFFFRSVLFSFLWLVCDALSLSAWIEYTFFDTKSTHISRIFRVLSIWIVNQQYFCRNMCNIVIYRIFTYIFSNFPWNPVSLYVSIPRFPQHLFSLAWQTTVLHLLHLQNKHES